MLDPNLPNDALYKPPDLKNLLGLLLILCGVGTALGVLFEIYMLFVHPQELAIFRPLFSDRFTINWEGSALTFPGEILAYGVPIVLLFIAGGLATTLLNGGISLMQRKH
jgi:hypothetical protein